MIYRILIPSGIGDWSWSWSKLVTTCDKYHIDYIGGKPDRMHAYLSLLPNDRILSFKANPDYATRWDGPELVVFPRNVSTHPFVTKARRYDTMAPMAGAGTGLATNSRMFFVESNTHLEAGNRIEGWLGDELPNTDLHYKIKGALDKCVKNNYFIVNYSSYGTKKAWGYYSVEDSAKFITFIAKETGMLPIFIGGDYDDYTQDIYLKLLDYKVNAVNLIGRTPALADVVALLQQAKLYAGACSGLMVLANVLYTPALVYYPPFAMPPGRKLAGTWHDKNIPYLSLFWDGVDKDIELSKQWLKNI